MEQVLAEHARWFEEMVRAREEEEEERRQKILALEEAARQLVGITAVIPDVTDPLESSDPHSHLDIDFPMSREEFRATWRITFYQDLAFDNYVSDSD